MKLSATPVMRGKEAADYRRTHGLPSTAIVYERAPWKVIDFADRWVAKERAKCTGPCTPFPINMAIAIVQHFEAKRWLDPCAGWGERLIGAMMTDVEQYIGVDPNVDMHPVYQKMLADLGTPRQKATYQLLPSKFETVKLPRGTLGNMDLVFTSPPFFTYEVYPHMQIWKTEEEFVETFLKPMIRTSIKALKSGGHLVLYTENGPGSHYVDTMREWIDKRINVLESQPTIYYAASKPRPYYVWRRK